MKTKIESWATKTIGTGCNLAKSYISCLCVYYKELVWSTIMLSREPIFDFDNTVNVDDRIVMNAICKASNDDVTTALVDVSTPTKAKIYKNMPSRRIRLIREDMIIKLRTWTPQSAKLAQRRILEIVNKLIFEES